MRSNRQRVNDDDVMELRREGGQWLRELREQAGLSQRALAEKVGLDYYTFVSQIEAGRGRIPPDRYRAWATALGMEPATFVKSILRFYEPTTYDILFSQEEMAG